MTNPPVTAATRVAGVIGMPVRHSLSPVIHNAAFAACGLDWVYVAWPVTPEAGPRAVEAMRTFDLGGLNVTMPHKQVVAETVDELTPVAKALGAVNCVAWDDDRLVGDNTDGPGFVDALREDPGFDPGGARCVVLGAGAAGRAVIWALAAAGAAEVVVVNRSPEPARRGQELAGAVGRVGESGDVVGADLIVNATSVGMGQSGTEGPLPFDPALLHNGQIVADLIYHPAKTPLLHASQAAGAVTVNGLGMLVHQAALSFQNWTGMTAPTQVMANAARSALAG